MIEGVPARGKAAIFERGIECLILVDRKIGVIKLISP